MTNDFVCMRLIAKFMKTRVFAANRYRNNGHVSAAFTITDYMIHHLV